MQEIILISISGTDQPGITSGVTDILAQSDVTILDIGQAVIHDTLSLGILIGVPPQSDSDPILKEVLFAAHSRGVRAQFTPVSPADYEAWVGGQGKPRFILTLLGRSISAECLSGVANLLGRHNLNIDKISRLSGRVPLDRRSDQTRACVELSLRGRVPDLQLLRDELFTTAEDLDVDIAFQEEGLFRRNRRLVVFDMDSTLIQTEVIDELADRAGVGDEVRAITEKAMRGELDFNQSLRQRVALLEGLEESTLAGIAETLPLTEGAERLLSQLKNLRYKTALISGGFTYFGRYLQKRLGIDYVFANDLEIKDGRLTGRVAGEVVDGTRKAALLKEIADLEDIRLEQVIAVGDGANDLPMLSTAGLGIAFHAKPLVRESARQSISTLGLDAILYLIGCRDREMAELAV